MSNADNNKDTDVCANCGKGEENGKSLKACTACKMVKYCNRECQIAHRPRHKKACKKRAAELHYEKLFKQPPLQYEDCPICFMLLPTLMPGRKYQTCCGKMICSGCVHAPVYDHEGNVLAETCPFCRTPRPASSPEIVQRIQKRVEARDAEAIFTLGCIYSKGLHGMPQNHTKALELWRRAGELGHADSYCKVGCAYALGDGAEIDKKKARHYYELAAMGGDADARHNVGCEEGQAGNIDLALRHFMIAVKGGSNDSLNGIQELFKKGCATKDD